MLYWQRVGGGGAGELELRAVVWGGGGRGEAGVRARGGGRSGASHSLRRWGEGGQGALAATSEPEDHGGTNT